MEKLNKLIFDGEEYLSKKALLKWIREISDAVNSFSDSGDPIRAQGANKVISLLLEKIEHPQEHWKPTEEQIKLLQYLSKGIDVASHERHVLDDMIDDLQKLM